MFIVVADISHWQSEKLQQKQLSGHWKFVFYRFEFSLPESEIERNYACCWRASTNGASYFYLNFNSHEYITFNSSKIDVLKKY
jgi:hypothetical protein